MKDDLWKRVSQKLRYARLRASLSIDDLSKSTGLPSEQLSQFEIDSRDMKFSQLEVVAEALDAEILSFFSESSSD